MRSKRFHYSLQNWQGSLDLQLALTECKQQPDLNFHYYFRSCLHPFLIECRLVLWVKMSKNWLKFELKLFRFFDAIQSP